MINGLFIWPLSFKIIDISREEAIHLKYGKMFTIVVGEKRGHIGRVFFVFFS